jgi:Acetyltransferase (GNAT) domain
MAHLDLSWSTKLVRLQYYLGELELFSVILSMLVCENHFTDLPDEVDNLTPASMLSEASHDGVLIRSHPLKQRCSRLTLVGKVIRYVPSQYQRYYVRVVGTFDEYLAKFSSKSRSTLKRKVRKFVEKADGENCFREYREPKEIMEFYDLARQVSRKTYQERLLDFGLPQDAEFCETMKRLAEQGLVRGYVLFFQKRPVAYVYCPVVCSGILLYAYVGYDPEFEDLSPGTVLQYFILEKTFNERKMKLFDFTEGEGPHKSFFGTDSMLCGNIYLLRWTPLNLLYVLLHILTDELSVASGKALDVLNLRRIVKKFLRTRTMPKEIEQDK